MTKVGIITHYYGSSNYGGVLQAYALCNFINAIGFEAEQICYNKKDTVTVKRRIGSLLRIMKKALHPRVCYYMLKRRKAFVNFRTNIIRHSENVYTESTADKVILQDKSNYRVVNLNNPFQEDAHCVFPQL